MADGKIFITLTKTSPTNCYICGAKPKEMNDLKNVETICTDYSILDFSCQLILHIAYRLAVDRVYKPYRVYAADKPDVNKRKKLIQKRLREEMSMLVDLGIRRSAVILGAMSCGHDFDAQVFESYGKDQKLSSSLITDGIACSIQFTRSYGSIVIQHAILPIGKLLISNIRECNTQKFSRTQNNEDIIHMLLCSSEPVVNGVLPKKKLKNFLPEFDSN